jgi:hypothetical protein
MKKFLSYSLLAIAAAGMSFADTATTAPVGYVTVTFPGNNSLTAVSVTLAKSPEYTGVSTSQTATTVVATGAGWSDGAWVGKLVYLENSSGAEEAFLITANTSNTLTVSAPFDLTTRYAGASKFTINAPHTVGSLFGTTPGEVKFAQGTVDVADLLYLWNGTGYTTYNFNGSTWRRSTSLGNANNDIVYPDEGFFVLRRSATPIDVVFSGQVPVKPQTTTIPGNGQTNVSSRFPVGATISSMGFQNLPGWSGTPAADADRVYVWNGTSYITYWFNGTNWRRSTSLGNANNDVIPANSFMFVFRTNASTANEFATSALPYTP